MVKITLKSKSFWLVVAMLIACYPAMEKVATRLRTIFQDAYAKGLVARVNQSTITTTDLHTAVEMLRAEIQEQHSSEAKKRFAEEKRNVLRDLIDRELLLEKAGELHINSEQAFDEMTRKFTIVQIAEMNRIMRNLGMPYAYFKQGMRQAILMAAVMNDQTDANVEVTENEIEKFYHTYMSSLSRIEEVRISEILLPTTGKETSDKKRELSASVKAKSMLAAIRAGARFEDIARTQADPKLAANGGDLGYFQRGELEKSLERAAFSMKKGQVSGVIETKRGPAIIMVTDHQFPGIPPLSAVHDEIADIIAMQKMYPAVRAYLTTLRDHAFIDIQAGYVDSGADLEGQPGPGEIPQGIILLGLATLAVLVAQVVIVRFLKIKLFSS